MKKVLSSILTFALVVPVSLVPGVANAVSPTYSVHINTPVTASNPLSISGTTSGIHYVGQQSAQHVVINWGDGSTNTDLPIPASAFNGSDFSWNWGPQTHSYTNTVTQSYKIVVNVCHQTCSGNEGSGDSTDTSIVVVPPQGNLIVKKVVINNNGGTSQPAAFSFAVNGLATTSFIQIDSTHGENHLVKNVGTYTVTETPAPGYTTTYSNCTNIAVPLNGSVTCTITNDDIAVNHAPVASNSSVITNEDNATSSSVTATDADGDSLTYATTTNPAHGTLTFNSANGNFTYTPNANYNGSDSFNFKANDGTVDSNVSTVSITVVPVNDNPVLALSTTTSITINELTNLTFTASGTDVDGDTLTFGLSSNPTGSTIDPTTGVFSWTPTEAQGPGTYPFTVTVSDGHGGTDSKLVTVTVLEVNVPPVANSTSVSTHQNTPVTITLSGSDSDLPLNTLTFLIVNSPLNGLLGPILAGNQVTYTPNANYTGPDSFTFKINDGLADSNTATVNIDVNDHAPVLSPIADIVTDELVPLTVTASATDPDSDPLTYSITNAPAGSSFDTSTGVLTWTPSESDGPGFFPGITISVSDGANTDSKTFSITVNEVNVAPVTADQTLTTNEDTAVSGTVTATDSDIPANTLTFATTTNPTNGTLTLDASTGAFTYTPASNYNGSDSFTFKANDGTADSNVSTVHITVTPVNDPPTVTLIGANPLNFVATTTTFVDPGATGNDIEDGPLTPVVTGSVDLTTPGTYTLTYTVTDSGGLSASTTRDVIVTAAPVENTASLCSDGLDNDGDGLIDLADPDCAAFIPAPPTPPVTPPSGGGGGNGPVAGSLGGGGSVLGASTVGQVLGESCGVYMDKHVRLGSKKNDSTQVEKLQEFLNKEMGTNLPITGFYGNLTNAVVKSFQEKYSGEVLKPWGITAGTGLVYLSTLRQINNIECPGLSAELPPLVPWSQNPNAQ